jgi:hypothetical protein
MEHTTNNEKQKEIATPAEKTKQKTRTKTAMENMMILTKKRYRENRSKYLKADFPILLDEYPEVAAPAALRFPFRPPHRL